MPVHKAVLCCAGQRIQLKASLEGVTFAPAPEASPASSSPTSAAAQEISQATRPGKMDKVWDCMLRVDLEARLKPIVPEMYWCYICAALFPAPQSPEVLEHAPMPGI